MQVLRDVVGRGHFSTAKRKGYSSRGTFECHLRQGCTLLFAVYWLSGLCWGRIGGAGGCGAGILLCIRGGLGGCRPLASAFVCSALCCAIIGGVFGAGTIFGVE